MPKHAPHCLIYVCTCKLLKVKESVKQCEHPGECDCQECHAEREAAKDRDFDERSALGYI